MSICDGCEGDRFCGIQDDMRHPDYKCPIPERFRELTSQSRVHRQHRMLYQGQRDELKEKLEAVKKLKDEYKEEITDSSLPYNVVLKHIVYTLEKILEGSELDPKGEDGGENE